MGRKD